jgi:hypothetical protein
MKKIFTLAILSLSLISCSTEEVNCNCGTVLTTTHIENNLFLLKVKNNCGEIKEEYFTQGLNIENGENGIIVPQPNELYCFRIN